MLRNNYSLKFTYLIIVLLIIFMFSVFTLRVYGSSENEEYIAVTVQEGETLWSITKNNCNNYKDIRKAIYKIKKSNNLSSANIFPGQILKIPVELYN